MSAQRRASRSRSFSDFWQHPAGRGQPLRFEQLEARRLLAIDFAPSVATSAPLIAETQPLAEINPLLAQGDSLVVTQQPPSTMVAGSTFTVKVAAENGQSIVDTSFGDTLSMYAANGLVTATAVDGVATFSNLTANIVGSTQLGIFDSNVYQVSTNSYTVTPAAATHFRLTNVYPNSYAIFGQIVAGEQNSLELNALDPYGNTDTNFNGDVSVAMANNPGGATLGGTLTIPAKGGYATFDDLTFSEGGIGYTLQVTASGLTAATTLPFNVDNRLVVVDQPPANLVAGTPFTVSVKDVDGAGNLVSDFDGQVTVDDNYYNSITGTLQVNAVNGVATFTGLALTKTSSFDQLTFTATNEASVQSNSIVVTPAPVSQLIIEPGYPSTNQFGLGNTFVAGQPFYLAVDVEDAYGNIETSSTAPIAVALASNPGNATLGGTLTVNAQYGIANFNDLTISTGGSGYKLQVSTDGLPAVTTAAFDVQNQLAVHVQPPANVTAGVFFGATVEVVDGNGNVVTDFNGPVTVSNYYFNATLKGPLTVNAVNGVAAFANLEIDTANPYNKLEFDADGVASVLSNQFAVNPAPTPTQLAFAYSVAGPIQAGAPFDVKVDAEDQFGNLASLFNGNITIALGTDPGNATLGGTLTIAAKNGVADFSNLTISAGATGYELQATSSGLTSDTSDTFEVVNQLVILNQPPTTVVAGEPFGLKVAVEDGDGNVVTSFTGSIAASNYLFTDTLSGTDTVDAVGGIATFNNLILEKTGISESLRLSSGDMPFVSTNGIDVTPAAADHLAVEDGYPSGSQIAYDGAALAAAPVYLAVDADDPLGNVDTSYDGPVTVALTTNPTSANFGGTLTVNAVNGVAMFKDLTISQPGTGYVLSANAPKLTGTASNPFAIAGQLVITTEPPATVTAGIPFSLTVTDEDALGNPISDFNGTVTISSTFLGNAVSGTLSATAVDGVATFDNLILTTVGSFNKLTATADGQQLATTSNIVVNPSPIATQLQFGPIALPGLYVAGQAFDIEVEAVDAAGDLASSFDGSVTIALGANPSGTTLGGTLTVSAVNGVADFGDLSLGAVGAGYTLQATSGVLTPVTSSPFNVGGELVVIAQPPATAIAGTPFSLTIADEDAFGNLITSFNGTVTLQNNPLLQSLSGTASVTALDGVATFNNLIFTAVSSSNQLTASAFDQQPVTTGKIAVSPATADHLSTSGLSSAVVAGSSMSLTVTVLDLYGNVDTNFNGSVTIALLNNPGNATLGGTVTVDAVHGVATFNDLAIGALGNQYTLQATSNGVTAVTTNAFDIIDQLVINVAPPTTIVTDGTFSVTIYAENALGVIDTSFSGSVTVALANGANGTLGGTLTVTFVDGIAVFEDLSINNFGAGFALVFSGTNLVSITSTTIDITDELVINVAPPTTIVTDGTFSVTIYAENALGVIDTSFSGSVTVALANGANGTLGGTLTVTFVDGIAVFEDLSINNFGTGFALVFSGTNLVSITSTTIDITDELVINVAPPTTIVTDGTFSVTIYAENALGVIDTSFSGSVTVALANGANGTLGGTLTVTFVDGIAVFEDLSINNFGTGFALVFSGTNLVSITSTTISVVDDLLLTVEPPSSVTVGESWSLTIWAVNIAQVLDTSFHGSVTVVLANNPGNATLHGTLTVTFVDGIAVFDDLSIDQPGIGYTLSLSVANGSAVTTDAISVAPAIAQSGPRVAAVLVDSTQWSSSFLSYLQSTDLGSGGYAIPAGSTQLAPLDWFDIDQIKIVFSEGVNVTQSDLAIVGTHGNSLDVSSFHYDATTFTATWTLTAPLAANQVHLTLDGTSSSAVTDTLGNKLDGQWTNGASQFPSGDGESGKDFGFQVNVVPGAINGQMQPTPLDALQIINFLIAHGSGSSDTVGTKLATLDINGDGNITPLDALLVLNVVNSSLSIASAPAEVAATGTTPVTFSVTLAHPSKQTIMVDYATSDGTAVAGIDYQATSGQLIFAPGETTKTITVLANGQAGAASTKTFHVTLSNPVNAIIQDTVHPGLGTLNFGDAPATSPVALANSAPLAGPDGTGSPLNQLLLTDLAFATTTNFRSTGSPWIDTLDND